MLREQAVSAARPSTFRPLLHTLTEHVLQISLLLTCKHHFVCMNKAEYLGDPGMVWLWMTELNLFTREYCVPGALNGFDYETICSSRCTVHGKNPANILPYIKQQSQMSKSLFHPVYLEMYLWFTLVAKLWAHMFISTSCDWFLLSLLAPRRSEEYGDVVLQKWMKSLEHKASSSLIKKTPSVITHISGGHWCFSSSLFAVQLSSVEKQCSVVKKVVRR